MTGIVIVRPDDSWPAQYEKTARVVSDLLGETAQRIDHIGSTSVPRLPAKDIIDMQVTVGTEPELDDVVERMAAADWEVRPPKRDHAVPGLPADDLQWVKRLLVEPMYRRRVNLHIRVAGRANQRYALLFRDYLRNHPDTARAYGEFKRRAAALPIESTAEYSDLKDPVCDLIYLPAEEWAARTGWTA
ncbi:GrpB family protein [Kribbella sp. NBC_00889]|uniref:GrpB family protein n=1 Tax=Kribbella sp. NBC_00889 TaxID=2975974 RepID=UPI00386953BC|nr:GrpB family protein [Kribbella sp. NBC_00889]